MKSARFDALDKANSAWHDLAVTFGGPRRRTMISRMLRYLLVTAALFYYLTLPQPAFAHSLEAPSEWKEFGPQSANGLVQYTQPGTLRTRRTELGLVERSDQGRGITLGHIGGNAPGFEQPGPFMTKAYTFPSIDQYLRERLMPVEGTIPNIVGIDMYGNSIPAGTVGGDLFEYINFQQRYDIAARIQRALRLSNEFLELLPPGAPLRNSVDDHVQWLKARPDYSAEIEMEFRDAKSSEQVRVAEDLNDLYFTAGVLLVDAQGHGIISAKIASTVHDTFHALMLTELDRYGKTTPELFENLNLRLAQSVTARNALGMSEKENAREIATMLYGELRPGGHFRFVNFGHPPALVFSAESRKFVNIDQSRMVQFLPLGLQIPWDHPDRKKYYSMQFRPRELNSSDVAEITLIGPGDILVLYTDGVYDGSDEEVREQLEMILREHDTQGARDICNALLDYAVEQDEHLRQIGDGSLIDDKTVFIIKRLETSSS